jgi:hypothetical protein
MTSVVHETWPRRFSLDFEELSIANGERQGSIDPCTIGRFARTLTEITWSDPGPEPVVTCSERVFVVSSRVYEFRVQETHAFEHGVREKNEIAVEHVARHGLQRRWQALEA